tara:strand:+ start:150 stop:584 length:435 start_codon:yes stop_codon:yes gene_type:complete
MKPVKNKKRIDPRYFLNETQESTPPNDDFSRFKDLPGYEDESVPGKTARQSRSTPPAPSRGGHSPNHPRADIYDKQMDDLDRWLAEDEIEESVTDNEYAEPMTMGQVLTSLQDAMGRSKDSMEIAQLLRKIADQIETSHKVRDN